MPIDFQTIPTADRVPFTFVEWNNTNALPPQVQQFQAWMIGQSAAGSAGVLNTPTLVSSLAQAQNSYGPGSMLAQMCRVWFQNNTSTPLWITALADNEAGTKSTATLTIPSVAITGATNATPIVVTAAGHGLTTGQKVVVASVGGNTNANGTNYVSVLSASTFALYSDAGLTTAIAGNAAYTAATGTVTGCALASGTLAFYIGGRQYVAGIVAGMAPSQTATALAGAINADTTCCVTAVAAGSVVTLTVNWAGVANMGPGSTYDLDLRFNYLSGDAYPAGVTFVIAQTAAGTGNPNISSAITAVGDTQYNVVVNPYTDALNLPLLVAELNRRGGPTLQAYGVAVSALAGTMGSAATFGATQNALFVTVTPANSMPSPSWEYAAGIAAVVAFYGNQDPAAPFQTLPIAGIYPPAPADRFTMSEQNTLLYTGMSTFAVSASGVVSIQRLITTYQTNQAGAPDASYLDVPTIFTLSRLTYDVRTMIATKYPRSKLASDGITYSVGQNVVTPKTITAELVALAQGWASDAIIQDVPAFVSGLIVERNSTNPNRLDVLMPPNLMNQFMTAAIQIQFVLLEATAAG